jgi:cell division protein FtsI (penicillin-binding protein 3)
VNVAPPPNWRVTLKRRTLIGAMAFLLWAVGIEARLVYLQVYRHADLVARADRQQMRTITAPAKRGDILDRKGRVLATSVDADSVYAVPSDVTDVDEVVEKLCDAFGDCASRERQALADRLRQQRAFAYVRRQVSPEEARRIAALNLDGIGFIKESRRFYPNKQLAAHLLGYVGLDNAGLSGVESTYDSKIRGKAGTVLIQTDARRHAFSRFERPPTSGSTVELTLDEYLQHVVERELHAGVVANRAAGGSAIIMDPHTGEILAIANEPTFNPNAYREFDDVDRRNRAVQDLYEPGSTFKVVTASAAIEERVLPLDAMIDTNPGQIRIGARVVREASGHNYGVLSMSDVIVKSSNVGAIKIGFQVGTERLSRFVQRFGFGHPVSADFPGENPGIVWDAASWTESALASVAMGYQVGVTPLQMITAVSSIANGGTLVEPHAVRAIYRDNVRYAVQPKVVRRTVTPDTAAVLTTIMEGVVERGTAKAAQINGYTIAGKTGTAAKLVGGHYSHSDYNASFVGFIPSRTPAVSMIVVIDSPHAGVTTGGAVSAPVFKRIAEATLLYLGVGQTVNPPAPVVVAARTDSPAATPAQQPVLRLVREGPSGTLPDLCGMSAREAVQQLAALGLTAHMTGQGSVASQEPEAGAALDAVSSCRLHLERGPTSCSERAAQP